MTAAYSSSTQLVADQWRCERIGEKSDRHIVLYHTCGHYECVEYNGLREFPSGHEFAVQMSQFAARHPEHPYKEDVELHALEEQEKAAGQAPQSAKRATPKSKRRSQSKVASAPDLSDSTTAPEAGPQADRSDGVKQLPAFIAQVAKHGPLYERVSFHRGAGEEGSGRARPQQQETARPPHCVPWSDVADGCRDLPLVDR